MAVTITTTPPFALPAATVKTTVGLTGGGNLARIWLTAAPEGSKLGNELGKLGTGARLEVASDDPLTITQLELDRGGRYTFQTQEVQRGASAHGGGYAGDPKGFPTETLIGTEDTVVVDIGEQLETTINSVGYGGATLTLWMFGDTIRETTLEAHGVITPALTGNSDRATVAAEQATVTAAVATLIDVTAADAVGDLDAMVLDMRTILPAHFINGVSHAAADPDNGPEILRLPGTPSSPEGIGKAASVLRRRLDQHMRNDVLSPLGIDYHVTSGATPDLTNAGISAFPAGANMANNLSVLADTFRAYEAHRLDTVAHGVPDVTNPLLPASAGGPLLSVHRVFLDELRKLSPPVPETVNPGTVRLLHGGGFTRSA